MATITNKNLGNANSSADYTYHSVTGEDIKITVSAGWYAVLREEDRKEYNNGHTFNRHRGYSGYYDAETGEYDDNPLYDDVFDKRTFSKNELTLEDRDTISSFIRWVRKTLSNKPVWADIIITTCVVSKKERLSVREYAKIRNMNDNSVYQMRNRALAHLREARDNGNGCPI